MSLFTDLRAMIDDSESVDDLMTIGQTAEPGALSKTEDAELTARFHAKWNVLKRRARDRESE